MFVVALVLLGVFWPTLSLHIMGWPLFWAVFIVLLLWVVVGSFRMSQSAKGFCTALNTNWSTWVASRKELAAKAAPAADPVKKYQSLHEEAAPPADAPPPAAGPENPYSAKDGGASHE